MSRPVPCQSVAIGDVVRTLARTYTERGRQSFPRGTPGRVIGRTYRFQSAVEVLHVFVSGETPGTGKTLLLSCSAVEITNPGEVT